MIVPTPVLRLCVSMVNELFSPLIYVKILCLKYICQKFFSCDMNLINYTFTLRRMKNFPVYQRRSARAGAIPATP